MSPTHATHICLIKLNGIVATNTTAVNKLDNKIATKKNNNITASELLRTLAFASKAMCDDNRNNIPPPITTATKNPNTGGDQSPATTTTSRDKSHRRDTNSSDGTRALEQLLHVDQSSLVHRRGPKSAVNARRSVTELRRCNQDQVEQQLRVDCQDQESSTSSKRHRKTVVYRRDYPGSDECDTRFPSVEYLIKMYASMLAKRKEDLNAATESNISKHSGDSVDSKMKNTSSSFPQQANGRSVSDEGCCAVQPSSSYSSDEENNDVEGSISKLNLRSREKVTRSSSSDSALGLDEEPDNESVPNPKRRSTLTVTDIPLRPALLPLVEPALLNCCDNILNFKGSGNVCSCIVPSKMILEAQVIELPAATSPQNEDTALDTSISRRESSQSCASDSCQDYTVRYVRTPSVVVSDYSDDVVCGITLEEIEYFRKHRLSRRRSSMDTKLTGEEEDLGSDLSAASSCSNLNYCGSHISVLDGMEWNYQAGLKTPERKISDCSTCSTLSGDEEEAGFRKQLVEALQKEEKKKKKVSQPE